MIHVDDNNIQLLTCPVDSRLWSQDLSEYASLDIGLALPDQRAENVLSEVRGFQSRL